MGKQHLLISVITVCYNAQDDILSTIESVNNQSYPYIEHIIKDGKSTDLTISIIQENTNDHLLLFESEDDGIYDAMNQGIKHAKGEYCIFLNAGDVFATADVVGKIAEYLKMHSEVDIVYGDGIFEYSNGESIYQRMSSHANSKWWYLLGSSICHQCMFVKNELMVHYPFNLEYKICSDREWIIRMIEHKKNFRHASFPVAKCLVDGYSLQNIEIYEDEVDRCISEHFGFSKSVWKIIKLLKSNPWASKFLRFFWRNIHRS